MIEPDDNDEFFGAVGGLLLLLSINFERNKMLLTFYCLCQFDILHNKCVPFYMPWK